MPRWTPLFAQPRLLGAQLGVIHHLENLVERGVMRQALEFQPGGAGRRIGIVGKQIAPPISAGSMPILAAASSTRPSVTAVAIGWPTARYWHMTFLFWNTDAGAGAIIGAGVRAADEIDDLVGLDAAGARIDRIGPDAGQIVDLERGDGAVALDADLRFDPMIAGVDVGDEAFEPVGDEFDRPLQQFRQRRRRHLVGIDVHLDAERAADILGEDAYLVLFETEVLGEQVLRHVRRLRALIHREALPRPDSSRRRWRAARW